MMFRRLNNSELVSLSMDICEQDVKQSLFGIGGLKALGPDGYPTIFFQNYWSCCKKDLVSLIADCFLKGYVPNDINQTIISLIPKVPNPTCMTQLRPISLCNTIYKIVSKILVQRIRPLLPNLVSPNQVAFVPVRQIQDNIVIAQEALHKFKKVNGKLGFMAWKIDLAKAYDNL
ncbi:hypothetical protein Dsin_022802 [Dipteronia sinensis]|uniref:Reverse transcriptase domain-containing protein n=1 Tax=Dipteronia sinensis TaxID=43782 RepID=A0AAE0A353_9ROSI|nr:hypothetical protein Dsin_022802 [Dipteronia sinensis]